MYLLNRLHSLPLSKAAILIDVLACFCSSVLKAHTSHRNRNREYDKSVALLALNLAPSFTAPKAIAARAKVQEALKQFYVAELDRGSDVAALVHSRAQLLRRLGVREADFGVIEFTFPWVATTNTFPTLFWFFVHVFTRPDYVETIRAEVLAITTITSGDGGGGGAARKAIINITKLEKSCPFLMACYREVLRIYNWNTGHRRVLQDTTIRGSDGREFLLTKGTTVQWISAVTQLNASIWGDDVDDFKPERWIDTPANEEKRRRGAMIPFGGGRNLCPGRNFALAENLGLVGSLALGFDKDDVKVPKAGMPIMGTAVKQPILAGSESVVSIGRRKGWEDVGWNFVC